ncbi:hypothetical protein D3C71_1098600 [compost metagenome]
MGLRGGAGACGKDELLQPGQRRVVVGQRLVERQYRLGLEQFVAGNRQLAPQVEQLVLYLDKQLAHIGGNALAQQQADVGVEFVHVAQSMDAQAVFGNALVVAQSGGTGVAGARGDLCESVAHGVPR